MKEHLEIIIEKWREVPRKCREVPGTSSLFSGLQFAANDLEALLPSLSLTWSQEKPAKPGWYWFRHETVRSGWIVRVDGDLECPRDDFERFRWIERPFVTVEDIGANHKGCEWAGPIPLPEEGEMINLDEIKAKNYCQLFCVGEDGRYEVTEAAEEFSDLIAEVERLKSALSGTIATLDCWRNRPDMLDGQASYRRLRSHLIEVEEGKAFDWRWATDDPNGRFMDGEKNV